MFGRTDVLLRLLWKRIAFTSSSKVSILQSSSPPSSKTLWWCKGGHNYAFDEFPGSRFLGGGYGRCGQGHRTDWCGAGGPAAHKHLPPHRRGSCSPNPQPTAPDFFMLHDQGGSSHSLSKSRKTGLLNTGVSLLGSGEKNPSPWSL